jgi:hypothetical protein
MSENELSVPEQPVKPSTKSAKSAAEPALTIGMSELKDLIAAVVAQSSETSAKVIAEAIKESRKPYVDERDVENNKMMRQQMRESQERIAQRVAYSRANCPHFQGSNENSDFQGSLSSIAKLDLGNGVVFGICTNCLRPFWPGDPDYVQQMNRKCGNRTARAGQRFYLNPAATTVEASR